MLPTGVSPSYTTMVEPASAVVVKAGVGLFVMLSVSMFESVAAVKSGVAGAEGATTSLVAVGVVAAVLTFPAASVAVTEGVTVPSARVVVSSVMSYAPVPFAEPLTVTNAEAVSVSVALTVEFASAVPMT